MSERMTPAQRERIRKFYQEGVFIRENMPSCVLRLIEDLEAVERERDEARAERDEAREAARWFYETYDGPCIEETKTEALERWPWLEK